MTPEWVNETVRAFGRQLQFENLELNERGAAGIRFENGLSFYLEYADGAMQMSAGFAADETAATLKNLLAGVHPSARTGGVRLRAVRFERTGEARFVARLTDRELTPTAMEAAFHALWEAADYQRRARS